MASPSLEYLNNVWQYVPQGHEKALKQAVYNTVANIFVLLVAGAFIAVYFVFSPFLRPLCWALLCGTFLYPFKRTLTDLLRGWLKGLTSSGTPFIVGLIILPVQVVTTTSGALSNAIYSHLAIIVALFAGILVLQLIYHFGPLHNLANAALAFLTFLNDFVSYFSSLWVRDRWNNFAVAEVLNRIPACKTSGVLVLEAGIFLCILNWWFIYALVNTAHRAHVHTWKCAF